MRKLLTLFLIIAMQYANAQVVDDISIFNRLLIFNKQNELLIVKIENTDFWVTPGLYQNKRQSIKNGLDSIASTYGLELREHKLNGTFILKRKIKDEDSTSLRNIFTAKTINAKAIVPEGIEEIKWISSEKAMEKITFPHINLFIKQITEAPDKVWGGSLLQFKEGDKWRTEIIEEFYTL